MGQRFIPLGIVLTLVDQAMPDVNLSWTDLYSQLSGAYTVEYYYVYRMQVGSERTFHKYGQVAGTTYTYADTGVTAGTTYRYKVTAVIRSVGEYVESNIVEATPYVPGLQYLTLGSQVNAHVQNYEFDGDFAMQELSDPYTGGSGITGDDWAAFLVDDGNRFIVSKHANNYSNSYQVDTDPPTAIAALLANALVSAFGLYDSSNRYLFAFDGNSVPYRYTLNAAADSVGAASTGGSMGFNEDFPHRHHCALDPDGFLWKFGRNGYFYKQQVISSIGNSWSQVKSVGKTSYNGAGCIGLISTTHVIGAFQDQATNRGMFAYVAKQDGTGGVSEIDLRYTGAQNVIEYPKQTLVYGNYAYITTDYGNEASVTEVEKPLVNIIDLTDPDSASLATRITITQNGVSWPFRIMVKGNYLYVFWVRHYHPLAQFYFWHYGVWNITDPTNPVEVSQGSIPLTVGYTYKQAFNVDSTEDENEGRNHTV